MTTTKVKGRESGVGRASGSGSDTTPPGGRFQDLVSWWNRSSSTEVTDGPVRSIESSPAMDQDALALEAETARSAAVPESDALTASEMEADRTALKVFSRTEASRSADLAIEVKDLVKNFGTVSAVRGVSFKVEKGEVFGLIGPNGAGKTTTMRMMATLLQVTSGSINVFGHDAANNTEEVRKIISYLPEEAGAYKNLTGRQYLEFIARFFAQGEAMEAMVERGTGVAKLGDRIDDKIETYSKGMTRRLLVGRALMFQPKLAILDELTSGLDVISAQQIRKVVRDSTLAGTTIIVSSHNMLEVELICDRIALVNNGKVVELGTPAGLKKKYDASNIEDVFVRVVG